jgi:ABC-type bacteriocin/lantibiotic exporter with double-glycine peptidase domain
MVVSVTTDGAGAPAVGPAANDPLLGSLLHAARHFGRPMTREALISRIAWDGKPMTPKLLLQSAETLGLRAEVRPLGFSALIDGALPAVAVLRDGDAVLLTTREADGALAYLRL